MTPEENARRMREAIAKTGWTPPEPQPARPSWAALASNPALAVGLQFDLGNRPLERFARGFLKPLPDNAVPDFAKPTQSDWEAKPGTVRRAVGDWLSRPGAPGESWPLIGPAGPMVRQMGGMIINDPVEALSEFSGYAPATRAIDAGKQAMEEQDPVAAAGQWARSIGEGGMSAATVAGNAYGAGKLAAKAYRGGPVAELPPVDAMGAVRGRAAKADIANPEQLQGMIDDAGARAASAEARIKPVDWSQVETPEPVAAAAPQSPRDWAINIEGRTAPQAAPAEPQSALSAMRDMFSVKNKMTGESVPVMVNPDPAKIEGLAASGVKLKWQMGPDGKTYVWEPRDWARHSEVADQFKFGMNRADLPKGNIDGPGDVSAFVAEAGDYRPRGGAPDASGAKAAADAKIATLSERMGMTDDAAERAALHDEINRTIREFVESTRGGGLAVAERPAVKPLGYDDWAPEWRAASDKGLDMSTEARMARAREQGFNVDEPLYHGTSQDFDSFIPSGSGHPAGPGVYLARDPSLADHYATVGSELDDIRVARDANGDRVAGPNIRKVFVRGPIAPSKEFEAAYKKAKPSLGRADVAAEKLRAKGFTGVQAGEDNTVFDPANIRSPNAAFDPDNIGKSNILGMSGGNLFDDGGPSIAESIAEWARGLGKKSMAANDQSLGFRLSESEPWEAKPPIYRDSRPQTVAPANEGPGPFPAGSPEDIATWAPDLQGYRGALDTQRRRGALEVIDGAEGAPSSSGPTILGSNGGSLGAEGRVRRPKSTLPTDPQIRQERLQGVRGQEPFNDDRLNAMQNKVVEMARNRYTDAEIADELELAPQTVQVYRMNARDLGIDVPQHRALSAQDDVLRLAQKGLTNQQIAERLGKNPNNVKQQIFKLRRAGLLPSTGNPARTIASAGLVAGTTYLPARLAADFAADQQEEGALPAWMANLPRDPIHARPGF